MSLHRRKLNTSIYGDQVCQFTKSAILPFVQNKRAAQDLQKKNFPIILDAILIGTTLRLVPSVSATRYMYLQNWERFYVAGEERVFLSQKRQKVIF